MDENLELTTLEDALSQIDEIKKSTVPKDQFDKIQAENKTLLKKIIDGVQPTAPTVDEKPKWKDLFNKSRQMTGNNTSNLELIKHNLEIKKHYPKRIKFASSPKEEQRILEFWTEIVAESNDDEATFNMLLKKRVERDPSLDNENGKLTNPNG